MIGHGGVTAHMVSPVHTDDGVHQCGILHNASCETNPLEVDLDRGIIVLPAGYGEALPAEPSRTRPTDVPGVPIGTSEPVKPE